MMISDHISFWGQNEKGLCKGISGFNVRVFRVSGPRSFAKQTAN